MMPRSTSHLKLCPLAVGGVEQTCLRVPSSMVPDSSPTWVWPRGSGVPGMGDEGWLVRGVPGTGWLQVHDPPGPQRPETGCRDSTRLTSMEGQKRLLDSWPSWSPWEKAGGLLHACRALSATSAAAAGCDRPGACLGGCSLRGVLLSEAAGLAQGLVHAPELGRNTRPKSGACKEGGLASGTLLGTQIWHDPRVQTRVLCTPRGTNRLCGGFLVTQDVCLLRTQGRGGLTGIAVQLGHCSVHVCTSLPGSFLCRSSSHPPAQPAHRLLSHQDHKCVRDLHWPWNCLPWVQPPQPGKGGLSKAEQAWSTPPASISTSASGMLIDSTRAGGTLAAGACQALKAYLATMWSFCEGSG